jgi:hypothetical protein
MRTFTTTHTVYAFDELSKEAKQKAIDEHREFEWEVGMEWLTDDMQNYLTEVLLPKYKMKCDDAKVFYRLSYSQGDGAMFTGNVQWKSWQCEVKQNGHYYHYNSKQFWNFQSIKTGREPKSNQTENDFNDAYVSLCQELERYGYDQIEYATSDETIIENIKANEYEFYSDGSMA